MLNVGNRNRNGHRRSGAGPFSNRSTSSPVRRQSSSPGNAKSSYERYVELARAAALTGDTVETENYYQHAEHYFRLMKGNTAS
jgi:uncharacterized protein DUF4167